jgi:uncharacterized protein with HEPN domain
VKHSSREWLLDALQHLSILRRYLDSSSADEGMLLDAAALRLSSAIESVSHIPEGVRREVIPDELWRTIKGLRNRIAHAYGFTSPVKLRQTVIEDVADFEASVRRLLEQVPE